MLRLFAAREDTDKERFIYENVSGETLIIVPDQYTLVAEEQAMRYMGTDCLFDTEILSMNRLGLRLLTEKGSESVPMLDKYGRFMLLRRLVREHIEDFDIFRRAAEKITFTEMLNDFISDFKQQDCTLDEITDMLEKSGTDPLLRAKLAELKGVIEAYEEAISGKYTDSEDYISMYIDAVSDSKLIRGKSIWIYGYDSITPKFTDAMIELAGAAESVSFIVNRTDFGLDEQIVEMLMRKGAERGIGVSLEEIGQGFEVTRSETIRRIEKGLWAGRRDPADVRDNRTFLPEDLTIVRASNPYYEAETAASYIWHLVRDLGYRLRDIQVIANDEGAMHPVIKRVFTEYGLPVFADTARKITDTAAAAFIVDLLMFVLHRNSPKHMFAMLKTGLAGPDAAPDLIEDLENYARDYRVRGSMWDRPFKYGEEALGPERFTAVNDFRASLMAKVNGLKEIAAVKTVGEFVPAFRAYLRDVWQLDKAVEDAAEEAASRGYVDEAQRDVQSYRKALEILDQIVEIMGDTEMDLAEFIDIYTTGLSSIEVGMIPSSADGLSVGTMIRTRPGRVRAAVILGANEGTLPLMPQQEGLFSVDEKRYFRERGFALGSLDDLKLNEENAAMYRMLSRPSEKIYISWSMTDTEGADASPSMLIDSLRELFPRIDQDGLIIRDLPSEEWGGRKLPAAAASAGAPAGASKDGVAAADSDLNTPAESMRHLVDRIKEGGTGSDPQKDALLRWFSDNRPEELSIMIRAAADENDPVPIGKETAAKLFGSRDGSLRLSASSIGAYFDCPFRYFVERGLRPREERSFTGDPRSIGDAYHECLMSIARRLIGDKELSALVTEDDEALERMVAEELDRIAAGYREGVFISSGSEEFRMSRIREICAAAARAMAVQLSSGSVIDALFEEGFGRNGRFAPVEMEIGGRKVYVEGKIDRSDMLAVEDGKRVRVIDYKTGGETVDLWKMRHGYKMQLMIYMISAVSGDLEPAGMFYFNIKDPIESADGKTADKTEELETKAPEDVFRLSGRYINEPGVLEAMPEKVLKPGRSRGGQQMSREEYEEVRADVLAQIEKTASDILSGRISIRPLRDGNRLVCEHCSYRPICRRDREYVKNSAREIPPAPKK